MKQLPVQIAESKIYVGFRWRSLRGSLELDDGFGSSTQTVQSLSRQHMSSGGIGILFEDLAELVQGAGIFLRPQAALRQHLAQLGICRIRIGGQFEMLRCLGKPLRSVVAQAQQSTRLQVIWIHR